MVRIKRIRKKKMHLMAAAFILTAAVLVLLITLGVIFIGKKLHSKSVDESVAAATAEVRNEPEASGGTDTVNNSVTAAEEPDSTLDNGKADDNPDDTENRENGNSADTEQYTVSDDSTKTRIDDDSMQDENSVVEQEIKDESAEKKVYLTFDDGPSVYTDEILDILKRYGVKATFFVCGTGDSDENLRHVYKRIVDEGHSIGMHSYSHVYSTVYGDLDLFQYDLDKIRNLIYNETGVAPKLYRFPGGSGNTIASLPMDRYISVLYSQGMEYYDWNVYGGDSSGNALSPSRIAGNTLDGVDRRDTAVILLHDTGSRRNTVLALPAIIEGLQGRGLTLCPIDDETPPLHQFDEKKNKD